MSKATRDLTLVSATRSAADFRFALVEEV